jgi:hypothetical protein
MASNSVPETSTPRLPPVLETRTRKLVNPERNALIMLYCNDRNVVCASPFQAVEYCPPSG